MSVSFKVTVNVSRGLHRLTRDPNGLVGRHLAKARDVAVQRAKDNVTRMGRVDTGRMRDTIYGTPVTATSDGLNASVIAPAPYSRFQHDGTRWITPAPFLTEALDSLKPRDFV